jgi:hypothetical protein
MHLMLEATHFRRNALITALAAFAIAFILWNMPQVSFLLYPLRLFVTFIHESGHGLAAILTGGSLDSFEVFANGTGLARTSGGNLAIILPAGYLGAALFGSVLLYLTNRVQHTRTITRVLGILLMVMTVLYTGILSTGFIVGIIGGGLLLYIGFKGGRWINLLLLNTLSVITAVHAVQG